MSQHRPSALRRSALIAIPAAAVLVLAGCSGSGSGTDSGNASGKTEFSFTFATSNNLESPYEALAKDYMAENPNVTITVNPTPNDKYGETIRTQLQAGNASDVIQTTPGSGDARGIIGLAKAGFLEPLDETASKLVPKDSSIIFQIDGKTYGQPLDFTIGAIVASMGTAKANGIDAFPTTMDDLFASCTTMKKADKSFLALAGAAGPNAGLTAQAIAATRVYAKDPNWNQQRIDGKTTFADSAGWKDTLQTIVDLNKGGCFQPGAEGGGFDAITNGLAQGTSVGSFIPSGSAVEIAKAAPAEAEFAVEPFPAKDGGTPYILGSSNYTLSISAASKKKKAAQDFLDWMASEKAQTKYYELSGELPISAYDKLDLSGTIYAPVVKLISEGKFATLPNNVWPNPSVYEALQVGVQGLLTGQKTIPQVLSDMDAAWGK